MLLTLARAISKNAAPGTSALPLTLQAGLSDHDLLNGTATANPNTTLLMLDMHELPLPPGCNACSGTYLWSRRYESWAQSSLQAKATA